VPGLPLTTTCTAAASGSLGRYPTNSVTVSIATNTTFQYDGNGNLTNDGLRSFAYDNENQLIQVWVTQAASRINRKPGMKLATLKEHLSTDRLHPKKSFYFDFALLCGNMCLYAPPGGE
jgi:hypothetical protein